MLLGKLFIGLMTCTLLSNCVGVAFSHRPSENVIKTEIRDEHYPIVAEGYGPIWESCESANEEAMKKLNKQLREGDKIANLEWYNFLNKSYSDTPSCVKETGWVWMVYTFWWPQATKVRVRAYPVNYQNGAIAQAKGPSAETPKKRKKSTKKPKKVAKKPVAKIKKNIKNPISLESYSVYTQKDRYDQDYVTLNLVVKNNGAERITAYKLTVIAKTKLGRDIGKFSLTNESASVHSMESTDDSYSWKDNPFINDEVYDSLAPVSSENLILDIIDQTVVRDSRGVAH